MDAQAWMGRVIAGLPNGWTMLKVVLNSRFSTLKEADLLNALTVEQERQREESLGSALYHKGGGKGADRSGKGKYGTKQGDRKGPSEPMTGWGKKGRAPPNHCHGCHKKGHSWKECRSRPGGAIPEFMQELWKKGKDGEAAAADDAKDTPKQEGFGELAVAIALGEATVAASNKQDS